MLTRALADPAAFAVGLYALPHAGPAPLEPAPPAGAAFLSWSAAGDSRIVAAASEALAAGVEPVVCVAQRGRTRTELLDGLRRLHAAGVRSLLALTGDYPAAGVGDGRPFDLDSVQLLLLLRRAAQSGELPEGFEAGCVVSPFKDTEAEQVWQYEKLARKVECGARFVVAQAGFDLRKHDELVRFCRLRGLDLPLLARLLVPDAATVSAAREGRMPGITIPDAVARLVEREGDGEAGRRERLLRAGRTAAALRGLGYRGVLLDGAFRRGEIAVLLEEAARRAGSWRECLEEPWVAPSRFYYFLPGERGEPNSDVPAPLGPRRRAHPMYLLSWAIDYVAFGSWPPLFRVLYRVCRFCDTRPFWRRGLWLFEYAAKAPMYGCVMCGDCTLYACGFLCYRSGCPKAALNGPCGGSSMGRCEVEPERRECFWVRVAARLRDAGQAPGFSAPPIPPRDLSLDRGCSWISFCLGRDHRRVESPLRDRAGSRPG